MTQQTQTRWHKAAEIALSVLALVLGLALFAILFYWAVREPLG